MTVKPFIEPDYELEHEQLLLVGRTLKKQAQWHSERGRHAQARILSEWSKQFYERGWNMKHPVPLTPNYY
jgi:hypothetical protein